MRDIGKNIRDIRALKNMTQEVLAEVLFVTRQTVSNYENGRSRPDIEMVLKIAEALDTDANSIIYGLSVPESKKQAYKWCWIMGGVCALLCVVYCMVQYFAKTGDIYHVHRLVLICKILVLPAMFALLGWILLQLLGMFCGLKPLISCLRKSGKILLWCVMGVLGIFLIPFAIFEFVVWIYSAHADSINMTFSLGEFYNTVSFYCILATFQFPFIYSVLGGLFWLLGIPNAGKLKADEK